MAALLYASFLLIALLSSSVGNVISDVSPDANYIKMHPADRKVIKEFIAASNGTLRVPLVLCDDLLFYCFPNGRIKYIYLAGKRLKGPIPPVLGNLTTLRGLFLQSNKYNGVIPSSFSALKDLQFLHLEINLLYGNVPTFLTRMPNLIDLSLSYNLFAGTVPAFPNALTLQFQSNYLSAFKRGGNGLPFCDKVELNCIFGANLLDCPSFKQRKRVHCRNFCNTTQAGGACGGNGVCNLRRGSGAFCICNAGFNNRAARFTCVKN